MERQVLKNRFQAGKPGDRFFGYTSQEVVDEFRSMRDRSDRFALLALYATCEGGIRADAHCAERGAMGSCIKPSSKPLRKIKWVRLQS